MRTCAFINGNSGYVLESSTAHHDACTHLPHRTCHPTLYIGNMRTREVSCLLRVTQLGLEAESLPTAALYDFQAPTPSAVSKVWAAA